MNSTVALELRSLDRAAVQPYVDLLSAWLLPDSFYGVQHTWPQLYRSDGGGHFLGLFAGPRLLSHCAWRLVDARTASGCHRVALVGSVATDPAARGQGHASRVLSAALEDCRRRGAVAALLWAERPELYARAGFVAGTPDDCLPLRAEPAACPPGSTVRLATIHDHAALHELHARKPLGVVRDRHAMSGLLTTPGMWTFVLERAGRVVAYACCGKGADLQNWWHELGGEDADLACLLPAAAAQLGAAATVVLVPPYRRSLPALLGQSGDECARIAGPLVCALTGAPLPPFWIDGLDSV